MFVKVSNNLLKHFERFLKLWVLCFDSLLVLFVLLLNMLDEFAEVLVVENESQDHGLVDIIRRKLIRIAFIYHLRYFSEVLGNLRGALLDYQIVLVAHFLQE